MITVYDKHVFVLDLKCSHPLNACSIAMFNEYMVFKQSFGCAVRANLTILLLGSFILKIILLLIKIITEIVLKS